MVELPQGILNLLVGVLGKHFRDTVYMPLADITELLTVAYSCINLLLFTLMRGQVGKKYCSL
jgi:hypothetical protein